MNAGAGSRTDASRREVTAGAVLRPCPRATVDERLPDWLHLYNQSFTGPPWHEPHRDVDAYRERIGWHLEHADLATWEARAPSGQLRGLAYGWPASGNWPEHPFYRALETGIGAERSNWLRAAATFEVVELMVSARSRGSGLGRLLLSRLCADQAVVWLATHRDSAAAGFYRHLGWRHLAGFTTTSGIPLEVFVKDAPVVD